VKQAMEARSFILTFPFIQAQYFVSSSNLAFYALLFFFINFEKAQNSAFRIA